MRLSEWARKNGVTYNTAHNWFKKGQLPVESKQLPTGTILVYPDKEISKNDETHNHVTLYARASSHDQKEDLKLKCLKMA